MRDVYGDRWRVKDALGSGGQSDVYLVEDTSDEFRETCALKQLQGDSKLGRFKQEIRVLRELEHPNIVRILDASLDDSDPYLVMKYYEQGSLADHPEEWLDAPARGISFFLGIVDAVRTGHERGVVHRDLKPGNILIEDHKSSSYPDFSLAFTSDFYRPVVSDFGICYYEEGDRHTRTKEAVGPRDYIAPELEDRRVENVDPVSDVYSLGKLLYWILSGGEVFTRERHRERDYDLVDITGNASLEMVNRVLDNMIVEDPRDRYSTLGPVVRGLEAAYRNIAGDYRVIKRNHRPQCTFCGVGQYHLHVKPEDNGEQNYGIANVNNANWAIMYCDACGHVQKFRVDLARHDDWWER